MPTSGPLDPFGDGLPAVMVPNVADAALRLWLQPLQPLLPVLRETADKPVAEMTMKELIAWGMVAFYAFSSGMLAATIARNIVRVAVAGR